MPNGIHLSVSTFKYLATILAEDKRFDEAIQVCQTAIDKGYTDDTKTGF